MTNRRIVFLEGNRSFLLKGDTLEIETADEALPALLRQGWEIVNLVGGSPSGRNEDGEATEAAAFVLIERA